MNGILEKKAKLVGSKEKGLLWLLNLRDDWIHDQYEESHIYYGTIYSSQNAFHPLSTSITGYFQDSETRKWIRVKDGVATFSQTNILLSWKDRLTDFLQLSAISKPYRYYKTKH